MLSRVLTWTKEQCAIVAELLGLSTNARNAKTARFVVHAEQRKQSAFRLVTFDAFRGTVFLPKTWLRRYTKTAQRSCQVTEFVATKTAFNLHT